MGKAVPLREFKEQDYLRFGDSLREDLSALALLLGDPRFGLGTGSLGAELELYIIDGDGKPLNRNREIHARAGDPLLTLELNRFNLEYNMAPVALDRRPFHSTEQRLQQALDRLEEHAVACGGRLVPIGILPTLTFHHFRAATMTDEPRYHLLKQALQASREGPFKVNIAGLDELLIETGDITFEGANTSFQLHYRVEPAAFADSFNALQLVTPLVLAVACNSPIAFGQRLWQETRVPLFKKSIDCRHEDHDRLGWHQPARVNYGHGWVREGAWELFAETVHLYPPLLPLCADEPSLAAVRAGKVPELEALKLHQGTVWLWNRPIYDAAGGGHLRIEMRALPSGPSVIDMVANAALAIGLMEGLKPRVRELLTALPFTYAVHNFYRAAEHGLDAALIWPDPQASSLHERPAGELLAALLPVAAEGLRAIGIDREESRHYLGVIERRLARRTNGAIWQLSCYEKLRRKLNDNVALHTMLEVYREQSRGNLPVADWRMPE